MNPSRSTSSESLAGSNVRDHQSLSRSTVSWGAIFAGAIAAMALQVLFMMLFAGLGFAIYSPATAENPVANVSIGALIVQTISALIALFLGGWVAGRFSPVYARATGWLHGFTVWCAATVGGVIFVAIGASWMMAGVAAVGQTAADVAGEGVDLAADAMEQSGDTVTSFVDEALSYLPEDNTAGEDIRAKREVGLALARLFNPLQDGNTPANRQAAIDELEYHTEMNQAEAERAVSDWTATYEELQADLAEIGEAAMEQAGEAADAAASALAKLALGAFFGFLLGALAATGGGHLGAQTATKCEETTDGDYSSGARSSSDRSDSPKRHAPDTKA